MVEKLIGIALAASCAAGKEAAQKQETAQARHVALGGYPFKGLGRGARQAGEEVVHGTFCFFRKAHLFHPNICQFAVEPLGRHEHARQKAALANVLFPQGSGEVVVVWQFFCHFTQARQFHAEYQFVIQAFLAHRGGRYAVHHAAQREFYVAQAVGKGV